MDEFTIRQPTLDDVDLIVELNKAAYPYLVEDNVVWQEHHIRSHLRIFPEGQLVVEDGSGQIVAAASSLIVSMGRDPHRDHTWAGITDNGMFYNHDPFGDTLYGADVNVHPDFRRKGLGRYLYRAREALCRKLNLRRIVLGGRLYDYCEHAETSAEEYAQRVARGELQDTVLTFQLAMGFTLKRVMASYLKDSRSLNFGTFLEWLNPDYHARARKPKSIRVSCVQYRMRKLQDFDGFAQQVAFFVDVAANYGSDYVLFPELLTAQLMSCMKAHTPIEAIRQLADLTPRVDELFKKLAHEHQIAIIGGTQPRRRADGGAIENVASMYLPDGTRLDQPKLHVTPNERRSWGIEGGSTLRVFDTPKARVGILVCYDVEFPETARYLSDHGAEVIFVPFCTDDRQSYLRVRYCAQARAVENQVYLAMAGTVGNLPDAANMDIQYAQSAVLAPSDFPFARDGVAVEASVNTESVITIDLDIEALDEAIREGTVRQRQDRRTDLFGFTATL